MDLTKASSSSKDVETSLVSSSPAARVPLATAAAAATAAAETCEGPSAARDRSRKDLGRSASVLVSTGG
eukprot:CAMPEP_0114680660 /NCGR_PEP_ID=MMETSP0191-20121206/54424_1 /TAXON_ID=126664 /ORGANISM="Sorites sp." /LENGTH=68 /DNA_ID=CAMNT_0001957813 /DNA_START=93 /DNA_END=296 /DNA_ORIENTATION=-